MSKKDENPNDFTHESSTAGTSKAVRNVRECLCGCGEAVSGLPGSELVAEHEAALVARIIDQEYRSVAEFATAHSAGVAFNEAWDLRRWHPETAIGQRARGRVFAVPHLYSYGFDTHKTGAFEFPADLELQTVYDNIVYAGPRLDAALGEPFSGSKHAFDVIGMEAHKNGDSAFAEKLLLSATRLDVLDLQSWAFLSYVACDTGRYEDALGYAEAAVTVAERSIPRVFSGTLYTSRGLNRGYQMGRWCLMNALWELERFSDARRVAVDSLWLDPFNKDVALFMWCKNRNMTRAETHSVLHREHHCTEK